MPTTSAEDQSVGGDMNFRFVKTANAVRVRMFPILESLGLSDSTARAALSGAICPHLPCRKQRCVRPVQDNRWAESNPQGRIPFLGFRQLCGSLMADVSVILRGPPELQCFSSRSRVWSSFQHSRIEEKDCLALAVVACAIRHPYKL